MTFPADPSKSAQRAGVPRRAFLAGAGALFLGGCTTALPTAPTPALVAAPPPPPPPLMYAAMPNEQFPIPAVETEKLDRRFWRQEIDYPTDEQVGTLIVDTPGKYLYHVLPGGRAMRYGIGVGREGFAWAGRAIVAYKRKWPRWTPPDSMVARQPELEPYSIANGGMGPSLKNPLGARALYIHEGGRDTLYRLHGTPEASSIGNAVSSGCIRLVNQDVAHLYDTVRDGSAIVVIPDRSMSHLLV
ncbi:L,D-transpeptidase [Pseudaminobacter arsenicus]|uniref:L,D-transpeptidase n=1 Tax=Borborobacter arsenicus TaxID=1851146 RepID=A0A432V3T5_9HYPH|nr:L,D-transpeptidase [Pseudaminobacter arsenicus]RUM96770.1 L,D-transpeptidase [Pseudaminobacter arsenicus]